LSREERSRNEGKEEGQEETNYKEERFNYSETE